MKKIVALALASLMATSVSFAANPPQTSTQPSTQTPNNNQGQGKSGQPGPNFAAHKQKILNQLSERIQRLQAIQSCVQSAQDHEAIKACREQSGRN